MSATTPARTAASTSTPIKNQTAPVTDSPGTWRHPRLDEITRRRNASTFTEKNVRQIAYNASALLVIWLLQIMIRSYINPEYFSRSTRTYLAWGNRLLQIIPIVNIIAAALPLVRSQDDLNDIPLTEAQRKLLNLPPGSAPPTPNVKYNTPPRYSRTPSISGSVGSKASYTSSPLSGRGSPAVVNRAASGSPYSPITSPLQVKSFNGGLNGNRRSSFGSPIGMGVSAATGLFSETKSPSPSTGKRTSVGLNNKWLFERGRRSSGGTWGQ